MGPVNDIYIHNEKAGDRFVGRTVTGISFLTKEFTIYSCYFDYTYELIGTKQKIDAITEKNLVKK